MAWSNRKRGRWNVRLTIERELISNPQTRTVKYYNYAQYAMRIYLYIHSLPFIRVTLSYYLFYYYTILPHNSMTVGTYTYHTSIIIDLLKNVTIDYVRLCLADETKWEWKEKYNIVCRQNLSPLSIVPSRITLIMDAYELIPS